MNLIRIVAFSLMMSVAQGQWRNNECRGRSGYENVTIFEGVQCFGCYIYYPANMFPNGKPNFSLIDNVTRTVKDHQTGDVFILDPTNKSTPMYKAFANDKHAMKWVDCCLAAKQCCQKMLRDPLPHPNRKLCPRTWDGWQCWSDTEPGVVATSVCPDHVYFTTKVSCSKPAEKTCLNNGEWMKVIGYEWTNYVPCGVRETHFRRIYFHLGCLGASVAFLVPAIIIFLAYERLRVHRIYIHTNLFVSLYLSAISVIIFKSVVILNQLKYESGKNILSKNEPWCKFLSVSTKYFRLTNYCWMFCEGLYLHTLIAAAFTEQKNLYKFYILGWGFPLIPIITYSILRLTMADEDCWTIPSGNYEWITNAPMLLALGLNLIFLCDINRVLVTKLRTKNNSQEPTQYRKAVRATLVLIPLFGLHSIMAIYRPPADACKLSEVYSYVNDGLDGLQGLIVALIFCYTNNEVLNLLKRTYNRWKLKRFSENDNVSSNRSTSLSVITRSSMIPETGM